MSAPRGRPTRRRGGQVTRTVQGHRLVKPPEVATGGHVQRLAHVKVEPSVGAEVLLQDDTHVHEQVLLLAVAQDPQLLC